MEAAKTGSEISYKSLQINKKQQHNEKCCQLMMNECCDLGVTKFLSYY
jgi:hypothetical protein